MLYLKTLLFTALTLFFTGTPLSAQETAVFYKTFVLEGITFQVTSSNESSLSKLTIKTKGLERNEIITKEIDGTVSGAEIADLNDDGAPEIYIFTTSAGSGSYGSIIAYSSNNNKSISEIYFPEIDPKNKAFKGYMGHDGFSIIKNRLIRRFPIYKENDSNAKPTGGMRQFMYKLILGEALPC